MYNKLEDFLFNENSKAMMRIFFKLTLAFIFIFIFFLQSCETKLSDIERNLDSKSEVLESVESADLTPAKSVVQIDEVSIQNMDYQYFSSIKFYWDENNNLARFRTIVTNVETVAFESFLCTLYYKSIGSDRFKVGGLKVEKILPDGTSHYFKSYPILQYYDDFISYVFSDPLFSHFNFKEFKVNKFNQLMFSRCSKGLLGGGDEFETKYEYDENSMLETLSVVGNKESVNLTRTELKHDKKQLNLFSSIDPFVLNLVNSFFSLGSGVARMTVPSEYEKSEYLRYSLLSSVLFAGSDEYPFSTKFKLNVSGSDVESFVDSQVTTYFIFDKYYYPEVIKQEITGQDSKNATFNLINISYNVL